MQRTMPMKEPSTADYTNGEREMVLGKQWAMKRAMVSES